MPKLDYAQLNKISNRIDDYGSSKVSTVYTTPLGERVDINLEENDHVLFGSETPVYVARSVGSKTVYDTYVRKTELKIKTTLFMI